MIPHGLTKKEYDAIPDSHVHLTNGLDLIHKMPSIGEKALKEKLDAGWEICQKDGSTASADEAKEIKAFVKKIETNAAKREKKRAADEKAQRASSKADSKALDEANAARDAAAEKAEAALHRAEAAEEELAILRKDQAEGDIERSPDKELETGDIKV